MSAHFTGVTERSNSGTVTSAWWNALRTAGIALEAIVTALVGGGGSTAETTYAIADNTTGDITGMVASTAYRCTRFRYWVKRIATATVMEAGELIVLYDGTNFSLGRGAYVGTAGITFDVNSSTGQVTYTTDDMAGSYDTTNSKIGWTTTTQGTI